MAKKKHQFRVVQTTLRDVSSLYYVYRCTHCWKKVYIGKTIVRRLLTKKQPKGFVPAIFQELEDWLGECYGKDFYASRWFREDD